MEEEKRYIENPKTGKMIKVGSVTYKNLVKEGVDVRWKVGSLSELMEEMEVSQEELSFMTYGFIINQLMKHVDTEKVNVDTTSVNDDLMELLNGLNEFNPYDY